MVEWGQNHPHEQFFIQGLNDGNGDIKDDFLSCMFIDEDEYGYDKGNSGCWELERGLNT